MSLIREIWSLDTLGKLSMRNWSAAATVDVFFGTKIVPSSVSSPKMTGTLINFPSRKRLSV